MGAVGAHLSYISQHGDLDIETDEGQRVPKAAQKAMIEDWHLDLSAGLYREARGPGQQPRPVKLVHNIVLSMPAPTPSAKVLAAAKAFAREKFGLQHRYAMALHTHQQHPRVHLVVKAEREDGRGRLHIDKEMLRDWRQDFARMMRDQGIAANATPRAVRGQTRKAPSNAHYRAKRRVERSYVMRRRAQSVEQEFLRTGDIRDPARLKLANTRRAIIAAWLDVAAALKVQKETALADEVHWFATRQLPPPLTDKERLASDIIERPWAYRCMRENDRPRDRRIERTR